MTTLAREAPPEVSWANFINKQVDRNKALKRGHGLHRLFVGQTQGGKTTLARIMDRMKLTVLMLGTKPRDDSLDEYVTREGFTRIDHWPPTKKELKGKGEREQVKLLLWPKLRGYADLARMRELFRRAVRDVAIEGGWTLHIDEGLYVCSKRYLDLGDEIGEIASQGASNGLSMHLTLQRPSGVPVIAHQSCHELYIFKLGNTNDIRELASTGGYDTRDVATAIRGLNRGDPTQGHQFLYLPGRGGATWEVSEVPRDWV